MSWNIQSIKTGDVRGSQYVWHLVGQEEDLLLVANTKPPGQVLKEHI